MKLCLTLEEILQTGICRVFHILYVYVELIIGELGDLRNPYGAVGVGKRGGKEGGAETGHGINKKSSQRKKN